MQFKSLTHGVAAAAALLACAGALAETKLAFIEAGGLHHQLSGDFGSWNQLFVRGEAQVGDADRVRAELVQARQFGENGTLLVLGDTHTLGERDFVSFGGSTSTSGGFFPNYRLDATYNHKWLPGQNLVSTLGYTLVDSKDGHRDNALLLSATYYTANALVVQGGIRFNRSSPGSVGSNNKFIAVTQGRNKERLLSLYHGRGTEAYSYIGDNAFLVNFNSHVWTGTWRQWLTSNQGFQLRAESYSNPYYHRRGVEFALFQEF